MRTGRHPWKKRRHGGPKSRAKILWLIIAGMGWLSPATADAPAKALRDALKLEQIAETAPPPFQVRTFSGDTLTLENFRGKLLILHFWATWCLPCREEMPALNQLVIDFTDRPLAVLAVSIDAPSDTAAARKMAAQWQLQFPVAPALSGTITEAYWTWGVPVTYLVDPHGKLLGRILGTRNWQTPAVEAGLRAYLAAFPAPSPE